MTQNKCAKNAQELLLCIVGKFPMHFRGERCICPTCPVTPEFGMKNKSVCRKSAEKSQHHEYALLGTK